MKKEILLALVILAVITAACTTNPPTPTTPTTPTCQAPFKTIGSTCCLDNNNNNQCDDQEQLEQKTCQTDANCELDQCLGCINTEWGEANPQRPDCAQFPSNKYECKCVQNACSEVQKMTVEKVTAGSRIRFGAERLPITLEMQRDTRILFDAGAEDEVYKLDQLQDSQITLYYGKDRFIIKKGTSQTIGPLVFVYSGINTGSGTNFATIKVTLPEA